MTCALQFDKFKTIIIKQIDLYSIESPADSVTFAKQEIYLNSICNIIHIVRLF